jgi:YD repeat-containing protein
VTVSGVASNGVTFTVTYAPRVNAGGSEYTDGGGNSWAADQSYSVSNIWGHTGGSTFSTTNQIANTDDDVLYQSERFGNFGYKFDLANGRYNVTLHFAEIYSGTSGPNQRIFNVLIEGVQVLTYYDIAAQAGFETATTKTFPGILVQDGQLNIDLVTVVGNAKISAIQIQPDQPTKLGISSINNGTPPPATSSFPIIVQSQDSFGNPVNVASATGVSVTRQAGTGDLGGTLAGTIAAGTSQVTLSAVTYSKAENGVVLRASRTSGDNLAAGDSAPFTVVAGEATKLGFITQPGNTTAANNLPGPPVVAVQDSLGNTVTSSSAQITVAIGSNPGGGALSGTTAKNAAAGTAIFADLKISQTGNGYTLSASSPNLTGATSAAFNLAAGGTISGTITRSGGSTPIGGALIEALQSGVVKRTATTDGSGAYSMPGLAVGSYDVRASAGGHISQTQNGVSVTSGGTSAVNFSLPVATPTAGIVYIYDELQRLKSIIDPVGEAATYSYDAVGNLLSITRNNASQTSVIDFNLNGAPIGGTVTIYGTGFSATPSQNTVTFNGVGASVVSSTLTQIVVTVPAGATNGPIAVTSPAGSATSSTNFIVTGAPPGAPTIASFTPAIGTVGTTVTITGTNFDTTAANNEVRFNPTLAPVSTSTATSIEVTTPVDVRWGKFSVTTPGGTVTSTEDFFVPTAPYAAADVGFTGRMTINGTTLPVTLPASNKIGLVLFDGTVGQVVSLGIGGVTGGTYAITIYYPNGYQLYAVGGTVETLETTLYLPVTGTYMMRFVPTTGAPTLNVTLSEDFNAGTVVIDGSSALNVAFDRLGQRAWANFAGTAGQKLALAFAGLTSNITFTVYKPDGVTTLYSQGNIGSSEHILQLTDTGTYKILIDPNWGTLPTMNIWLSTADINVGALTLNQPSQSTNIGRIGQRGVATFNGTAGQKVSLQMTGVTIPGGLVTLFNPSLGQLTTGQKYDIKMELIDVGGSAGAKLQWRSPSTAQQVIPQSQLYLPGGSTAVGLQGDYFNNTTLSGAPALSRTDSTVNFTWSGSPGGSVPSDNFTARWTGQVQAQYSEEYEFCALADDGVRLWVNGIPLIDKWIVQGSYEWCSGAPLSLASAGFDKSGGFIDTVTLPATGTYMVLVDPYGGNLGNFSVTVYDVPSNAPTSITPNGPPVVVAVNTRGENPTLSFTGSVGQTVTLQMNGVTIPWSTVTILNPSLGSLSADQKYSIKMEYFEGSGGAAARLFWNSPTTVEQIIPQSQLYLTGGSTAVGLQGDYFNNTTLTGTPVLTRTDSTVDFSWSGSPGTGVNSDNFSVRWSGDVQAQFSETYEFCTVIDDGARLWVNSVPVINKWVFQGPTRWCSADPLSLASTGVGTGGTQFASIPKPPTLAK